MKNNNIKYLVFTISFIVSITNNKIPAFGNNEFNNNSVFIALIDENTNYEEAVNDIEEKFPMANIEGEEEIDMITIYNDNNYYNENNITQYLDDSEYFEDSTISNIIDFEPLIIGNSIDNYEIYNDETQDNLQQRDSFSTDFESIYDTWLWDIKNTTNNYESYKIEKGHNSVNVGIIDSGIDSNHPDLKNNIKNSYSMVPNEYSTTDEYGHGTMVAGVISANGNIKGVAPNIKITSYKVFKGTSSESSWVIRAIIRAAKDRMDVINISLGTYKSLINYEDKVIAKAYQRAIRYALARKCIVVASAGNKGVDLSNPQSTANALNKQGDLIIHLPGGGVGSCINVSAINKDNKKPAYSNYGNIDLAAYSGDYGPYWESEGLLDLSYMSLVTYPTNMPQSNISKYLNFEPGYEFSNGGTSLSAPKVTAVIALIISEYTDNYGIKPSLDYTLNVLFDSVSQAKDNYSYFGEGVVNAYDALNKVSEFGRKRPYGKNQHKLKNRVYNYVLNLKKAQ